jgi:hypothetical protein
MRNFITNIIRQIKSRRMRCVRQVAHMGEDRNVCRVLVEEPEGKRLFGRPRHRLEDRIRMDLKGSVELIHLAHNSDR